MHLVGMWISFLLGSVVLVATVSLVRRAHEGERLALAQERESRLRDEQVLSLGVLAASTAHELGTPLSTARLLVEEMEHETPTPDNVELLASQLDYVIDSLHRLVRVADWDEDEEVELETFCAQISDRFRTLRPETELSDRHDLGTPQRIRYGRPLESAILSLLMNGAAASARAGCSRVELTSTVGSDSLCLRIRDFGHGFHGGRTGPPDQHENGSSGMGVGLSISSATIECHGGEARHFDRDPGTEVVVTLPLHRLRPVP